MTIKPSDRSRNQTRELERFIKQFIPDAEVTAPTARLGAGGGTAFADINNPDGVEGVSSLAEAGGTEYTGDVTIQSSDGSITITPSATAQGADFDLTTAQTKTVSYSIPHMFIHGGGADLTLGPAAGSSAVYNYGLAATMPAASDNWFWSYRNQTSQNFTTAAVTDFKRLTLNVRRSFNQLIYSQHVLIYGQVPKISGTATANIVARESTTPASGAVTYGFFLTDGTTVSSATPTNNITSIGTSWDTFDSGSVNVSSYGDPLYWVFQVLGPTADAGSNINTTGVVDLHSVYISFS